MVQFLWCELFRNRGKDAKPIRLDTKEDLSSFNFFQRRTIREHMQFASRTFAQKTTEGQRVTVNLQEIPFVVHVHHRFGGLTCTAITDVSYPQRVIFTMMSQIMREFNEEWPEWVNSNQDGNVQSSVLIRMFEQYQNPEEADKVMKIQKNLDDVKDVMTKNIEDVLERGENLDELMVKSEDLSTVSYKFYKTAKNANSCCPV
jgi:synaptobrevin family protein YKT6